MRKNQVVIKVTRFGDEIPKSVQTIDNNISWYEFATYTDSNNVFEALAAAYLNILNHIKNDEHFPNFGDEGHITKTLGHKKSSFESNKYEHFKF